MIYFMSLDNPNQQKILFKNSVRKRVNQKLNALAKVFYSNRV